jgi:hypothetical protein
MSSSTMSLPQILHAEYIGRTDLQPDYPRQRVVFSWGLCGSIRLAPDQQIIQIELEPATLPKELEGLAVDQIDINHHDTPLASTTLVDHSRILPARLATPPGQVGLNLPSVRRTWITPVSLRLRPAVPLVELSHLIVALRLVAEREEVRRY